MSTTRIDDEDDHAVQRTTSTTTSSSNGGIRRQSKDTNDVVGAAADPKSDISSSSSSSSKRWSKGSEKIAEAATSTTDEEREAELTPPLPNGQKRLHPLLDEERIAKEAAEGAERNDAGCLDDDGLGHDHEDQSKTLRIMESMASDAGYPSPSGGFVPPVTDQDWSLADAPMTRARRATSSSSSSGTPLTSKAGIVGRRKSSIGSSAANRALAAVSSSSSSSITSGGGALQHSKAAESVDVTEEADTRSRAVSSVSSTTTTTTDTSDIDGHSQAISARSSPSTVAPNRRRSSGSADVLSHVGGNDHAEDGQDGFLPPLKIRDYAFDETDPRHVGARDVSLPSPTTRATTKDGSDEGMMGMLGGARLGGLRLGLGGGGGGGGVHEWAGSSEEYDDDDDDDDDDERGEESDGGGILSSAQPSSSSLGAQSGLPLGLYYAAYDFSAESEHELDVKVGQRVRLIGHVDGGWAIVVRVEQGQEDVSADDEQADKGLVPEAYLQWLAH